MFLFTSQKLGEHADLTMGQIQLGILQQGYTDNTVFRPINPNDVLKRAAFGIYNICKYSARMVLNVIKY